MNYYFQADTKLNAFDQFLKQTGFYESLPTFLHGWVDLESALNDYTKNGLNIENITNEIYYINFKN